MGPRLFSRGNSFVPSRGRYTSAGLQWGRGFSAAETLISPFNNSSALCLLQWGRGFSAAETINGSSGLCQINGLQWGRGFSAAETAVGAVGRSLPQIASMGPRLFSRGNFGQRRSGVSQKRRFNGAAAFQPRKRRGVGDDGPPQFGLQWGRGFSAAETRCDDGTLDHPTPGFNGAAAFQPRKPGSLLMVHLHHELLQWGRGFSAAETP